eukprot:766714-Hanusia_phi.AAC.3
MSYDEFFDHIWFDILECNTLPTSVSTKMLGLMESTTQDQIGETAENHFTASKSRSSVSSEKAISHLISEIMSPTANEVDTAMKPNVDQEVFARAGETPSVRNAHVTSENSSRTRHHAGESVPRPEEETLESRQRHSMEDSNERVSERVRSKEGGLSARKENTLQRISEHPHFHPDGRPMDEEFELVDSIYPGEPVWIDVKKGYDAPESVMESQRSKGFILEQSGLPQEVVHEGKNLELLISDVIQCSREIVEIANDRLRRQRPLASQALVLYLWSMKIVHRALQQMQHIQRACGGLLPCCLMSDWQNSILGHLADDYEKAKIAMRLCIESSKSSECCWVTSGGNLNDHAMASPAAPRPDRIAYDTAIRSARDAATRELLYSSSETGRDTRALYQRAILLLCSLMLDGRGSARDMEILSMYSEMLVERVELLAAQGGKAEGRGADGLAELVTRCSTVGRLWSDNILRGTQSYSTRSFMGRAAPVP